MYGSLGPTDPPFTETHPLRAQQPLFGQQGGQRPPGARLAPHLRPAGLTTNCTNNYGPYQFPEKLIPLMILNALAGKPLPVYGDGMQVRDWLYVEDHCCAIRAVLAARPAGETYNIGGWNEKPNIEIVHTRLRAARRIAARPGRHAYSRADHLRDGPARPRPPLRDRRPQDRARTGLAPAETFETGIRKTVAVVPGQPGLGGARAERQPIAMGRRTTTPNRGRRMKILLLGKDGQVGWELQRALAPLGELVALDRDDARACCGDLGDPERWPTRSVQCAPDVIVNAAAHTAVDKAESEPELARAINATAPGVLAPKPPRSGAWLVHYSTDYVFDGTGTRPWREDDATARSTSTAAPSSKANSSFAAAAAAHLILRTSWVYAPAAAISRKTMLRLAAERDGLNVIDDQAARRPAPSCSPTRPRRRSLQRSRAAMRRASTTWPQPARRTGTATPALSIDRARGCGLPGQGARGSDPCRCRPRLSRRRRSGPPIRAWTPPSCGRFGLALPAWQDGVERMLDES